MYLRIMFGMLFHNVDSLAQHNVRMNEILECISIYVNFYVYLVGDTMFDARVV
jgi:hypothetical protein